jgi:serine/threonine-protein kinase
MLPPHYLLQNRYRIAHQLGSGGFATVYLAYDTRLGNRPVAIKALNLAALAPADQQWVVEAFQQEALVLAELTHPGIAAILDFFITEQTQYLVMEHVAGETLADAINRIPGGRYHEVQVLSWARQLCDVLHYLHIHQPPIIFRDLKPQNIMVQPDGQLKMIDFGIARYFKPGQKRDTMAVGTPGYSAPEQHGQGQTDARSDIYALGVLLHQLLTGIDPAIKPFFFLPVRQVAPDITPHIADAVATALAHQPKDRFATVREFEQALLKPPSTLTTTIPLGPASGSC